MTFYSFFYANRFKYPWKLKPFLVCNSAFYFSLHEVETAKNNMQ